MGPRGKICDIFYSVVESVASFHSCHLNYVFCFFFFFSSPLNCRPGVSGAVALEILLTGEVIFVYLPFKILVFFCVCV